jgi:hypothetical protein
VEETVNAHSTEIALLKQTTRDIRACMLLLVVLEVVRIIVPMVLPRLAGG